MKRSRFTEERIIGILREQEAGRSTAEVCVASTAYRSRRCCAWKTKFGGMSVPDAKRWVGRSFR